MLGISIIRGFIISILVLSCFCTQGQYSLGEFQAGFGTHLGGHLETKNSGSNGFESADFAARSGWFVGYTHFINHLISIGVSYNETKGELEQNDSFQSNPPPDFTGKAWGASAFGVHVRAGTSRFNSIQVYGVFRYTFRSLESEAFPELFENSGERIRAYAITFGAGVDLNISQGLSITVVEFSVGQGSSGVGKYDGGFLQFGTLRAGVNFRIMKK